MNMFYDNNNTTKQDKCEEIYYFDQFQIEHSNILLWK